jgi:hypothetical protein
LARKCSGTDLLAILVVAVRTIITVSRLPGEESLIFISRRS